MSKLLIALTFAATLLAACASSSSSKAGVAAGSGKTGKSISMTLVDYRSGTRLELVNASHTDPVEQYSTARADASRKVQTDDLMDGLWDYLRDQGFERDAKNGNAPTVTPGAKGGYRWSLQVTRPEGTSYVGEADNAADKDRKRLLVFKKAFVDTYNATQGWQAVKVQPGEQPFRGPNLQGSNAKPPAKKGGQN